MVLDSEGIVPSGRETAIGMALVDAQMVARMRRTVGRRVVFEITSVQRDAATPARGICGAGRRALRRISWPRVRIARALNRVLTVY